MHTVRRAALIVACLVAMAAGARAAQPAARVSVDDEIKMGRDIAPVVRKKYKGTWTSPATLAHVRAIGMRLIAVSDRHDVEKLRRNYSFELLNTNLVNAMALPGGTTFVTRGLVDLHLTDDELAAVLGHEIAHAARRHGAQNVEKSRSLQDRFNSHFHRKLLRAFGKAGVLLYLHKRLDPKLEYEADYYGMLYAARAGYNPQGMVSLFERFQRLERGGKSSRWARLLSGILDNHPPTAQRIARARDLAARIQRHERVATTPVPVYP